MGHDVDIGSGVGSRPALVAALVLGMTSGCLDGAAPGEVGDPAQTGETTQETVYGIDNRQDVFAHSDLSLRHIAQQSGVALMNVGMIDDADPDRIAFNGSPLGIAENLCPGQRFADDPFAALCSGTLIDDDLVLTAGHCIADDDVCSLTRIVFNYFRDTATTQQTVTSQDVFRCASVVVREQGVVGSQNLDFEIIRLDRPATPRFTPAPVRQARSALGLQQRVGVIGTPTGIPLKIDSGGKVRDPRAAVGDFFVATTDSFASVAGAGVYELDQHTLAGVLVRGDTEYVASGSCNVVNTCAEAGCRGEDVTYVGPALDELCGTAPTDRLCEPRNAFPYTASNTASASVNTTQHFVALQPGQTLTAGTCGVPGASGTGDTYVRLIGPGGAVVAASDDACDEGLLSQVVFTAPPLVGGLYELQAGCFSSNACSGTVAYSVTGPQGGSYSYAATNTTSATINTADLRFTLSAGQTLTLGTCGVAGAEGTGDTELRLYDPANNLVAISDDGPGCGLLSQLSFTAPQLGIYTIRAGCFSSASCSGTVAYSVTGGGAMAYSATNTNSALQNTANFNIALAAGQTITLGTCGVPGSSGTGDTELRLYDPANINVATSDDGLGCGVLSELSFTAPTAGVYQLRAGCFSSATCSGTAAYALTSNDGGGAFSYSAANTTSATINTFDQPLVLQAGQTIQFATCGLAGSTGTGDTYLRLYGPDSELAALSDDACGGVLSQASFTVPAGSEGSYLIRAGCFSLNTCTGTVPFTVE